MRRQTQVIGLMMVLVCAEHAFSQKVAPDGQKPSFTMNISMKDNIVKPGLEIQIAVELTNISAERIWLWRSRSGPPPYTIRLLDRQGRGAPVTAKGRAFQRGEAVIRENGKTVRAFPGSGEQVSIGPNETVKDSVYIDDQFDLTQPGTYTIQLERIDPASKAVVKSNVVTLTVAN